MKYALLLLLCFLLPLLADGAAISRFRFQPVAVSATDTGSVANVVKPNYRKDKIRIVTGILLVALAGVFFYPSAGVITSLGVLMVIVGGLFFLAGILSLIDQSVRYRQRKQRHRKTNTNKIKD